MTSEGFVKAASNNLPAVNMFMVTEFIKNDERFNAEEFRGAKAAASSREEYGDSAVGYVQLKREGTVCTVNCKICPEHRVRSKNYSVTLTVDEVKEKVLDVVCNDCAAAAGSCKHALAFLMWVHRRSEEPSPTDVTSYWMKPRLSSVGTSLKFVTVDDFGKSVPVQDTPSTFRDEVLKLAQERKLSGQIVCYGSEEDKFAALAIFKSIFRFKRESGVNSTDFIGFCCKFMTEKLCNEAEKLTQGQTHSPFWHELRFDRITASKLFEFANCKTAEGTMVQQIIGAYKVEDTKQRKRGRELENQVLNHVKHKLNVKLVKCGFFILCSCPIFGASPDSMSVDSVVEVKCPTTDKAVHTYIKDGQITPKFKAQIHLQMLCAKKKKGWFCVADPNFETSKNVTVLEISYDDAFINDLITKAMDNYKRFVFPKLYESVS